MDETIRITRLPCRFGGTRPYFICPVVVNGIACGRRVAKLHGPGTDQPVTSTSLLYETPLSNISSLRLLTAPDRTKLLTRIGGRCGTPLHPCSLVSGTEPAHSLQITEKKGALRAFVTRAFSATPELAFLALARPPGGIIR